jgi:hypothetical protein
MAAAIPGAPPPAARNDVLPAARRLRLRLAPAPHPDFAMDDAQAEIAALKIILANVVARLAITLDRGGDGQVREVLAAMKDECKLAAEHATLSSSLAERGRMVNATLTHIDEFFKGITIT